MQQGMDVRNWCKTCGLVSAAAKISSVINGTTAVDSLKRLSKDDLNRLCAIGLEICQACLQKKKKKILG